MKKVENKQGFLVLEVSRAVIMGALANYGSTGICDSCAQSTDSGYYIAVLNQWFCPKCYEAWLSRAVRYVADVPIEERRFKFYEAVFRKVEKELC
ncbi:MAG: demethylase [Bacteroidales bacterium]|nr:demethylase [Bacteroidales bacterium]